MTIDTLSALRRTMVSNQLRPAGVADVRVLAAMAAIPRERYAREGQGALCYCDTVVPLGHGRALNPPIATGRLLDRARVTAGDHALLVGASTGYVAALLVALGARVTALEAADGPAARSDAEPADRSGRAEATRVTGPLAAGWPEAAPYDIVYVDGGIDHVPDALVAQLAEGGRLVAGVIDRGVSRLVSGRKAGAGFGFADFADVETAPLPGFAAEPAFSF